MADPKSDPPIPDDPPVDIVPCNVCARPIPCGARKCGNDNCGAYQNPYRRFFSGESVFGHLLTLAGALGAIFLVYYQLREAATKADVEALETRVQNTLIQNLKTYKRTTSFAVELIEDGTHSTNADKECLMLGINATGTLNLAREPIIRFIRAGGSVKILLLDPDSDEFKAKEKKELDEVRRIYKEQVASLAIIEDIINYTKEDKGSIEIRFHSLPHDRSVFCVNPKDDDSVLLVTRYDAPGSGSGLGGTKHIFIRNQHLPEFNDSISFFRKRWKDGTTKLKTGG